LSASAEQPLTNHKRDLDATMHILLTGSSGRVGSHTLRQLLARGYQVTALDIVPLPPTFMSQIPTTHHSSLRALVVDLTEFIALDAVFTTSTTPIDGIIHLSAIPNPYNHDDRQVHNNNVVANYNVLKTGAEHGVRRMVQASSVNAPGLSFPPEGHQRFDELPMDEETPMRPVSRSSPRGARPLPFPLPPELFTPQTPFQCG